MQVHRRRAVLITEMLTIIMVFMIGSGLILMALDSLLRAHDTVVGGSNRYAMIDDLLHQVRTDVRRAESAQLSTEAASGHVVQCLTLARAEGQAVYQVEGHRVTRSAVGPDASTHVWDDPDLSVRFVAMPAPPEARALVRMIVTWKPTRPHDTAPTREFDVTIGTAGERAWEEDRDD